MVSKNLYLTFRFILFSSFTMLMIVMLIGCSSTPRPPISQLVLDAQKNINPTVNRKESEAKPVVIRIYELNSDASFNSADFFSLFDHYKETLGNELLNSEKFNLSPGDKIKINKPLHFDTRYVGVVSAFRDIENAQWKSIAPIPAKEKEPEIYILLDGNRVMIEAKTECGFFCKLWSP